jgi:integrase
LKVDNPVVDAWTEEEVIRLLDAASAWPGEIILGVAAGDFWRALLLTLWYTALRRRAIFELTLDDVDFDTGWLHVPASAMKNRTAKKFRLGADALEALRRIHPPSAVAPPGAPSDKALSHKSPSAKASSRRKLFPWPHKPEVLSDQLKRILRRAEIPPSKRRSASLLHKVRRTVATMLAIRAGLAAACNLLGHSGEHVTKLYVDPTKIPGADVSQILPSITAPRHGTAGSRHKPPTAKAQRREERHSTSADFADERRFLIPIGEHLRIKVHVPQSASICEHLRIAL